MFKNLLLAVLTISTLYLGWMTVPGLRPIKDAHAAAFTTTKSGSVDLAPTYSSCATSIGNTSKADVKTKSGNEEVLFYDNVNTCSNGKVMRSVALVKEKDGSDDRLAIAIECCTANAQNVHH